MWNARYSGRDGGSKRGYNLAWLVFLVLLGSAPMAPAASTYNAVSPAEVVGDGTHEIRFTLQDPLQTGPWVNSPYRIVVRNKRALEAGLPSSIMGTTDAEGRTATLRLPNEASREGVSAWAIVGGDSTAAFQMGIRNAGGRPVVGQLYSVTLSSGDLYYGVSDASGETVELRSAQIDELAKLKLLGERPDDPHFLALMSRVNALFGMPPQDRFATLNRLRNEIATLPRTEQAGNAAEQARQALILTALHAGGASAESVHGRWLADRERELVAAPSHGIHGQGEPSAREKAKRVLLARILARLEWIDSLVSQSLSDGLWASILPMIEADARAAVGFASSCGEIAEADLDMVDDLAAKVGRRNAHSIALVLYDLWVRCGWGREGVKFYRMKTWQAYANSLQHVGRVAEANALREDIALLARYEKANEARRADDAPSSVMITAAVLDTMRNANVLRVDDSLLVLPADKRDAFGDVEVLRFLEALDAIVGHARLAPGAYDVRVPMEGESGDLPVKLETRRAIISQDALVALQTAAWSAYTLKAETRGRDNPGKAARMRELIDLQLALAALLQHGTISPGEYGALGIAASAFESRLDLF